MRASSLGTALFLNCYFKHVCKANGLGMAIGYRVCLFYVKKNEDNVSFWGKGWTGLSLKSIIVLGFSILGVSYL